MDSSSIVGSTIGKRGFVYIGCASGIGRANLGFVNCIHRRE